MMRKYLTISTVLLLIFSMSGRAYAEESYHITSAQLLDYCKDTVSMMSGGKDYNVSKSSWCIGFIQGSVTSHRFYSAYYTLKTPENRHLSDEALAKKIAEYQVYCVPSSINLGQIVRDVVKYLNANPKYQGEQASISVARALNQTYPCQ